MFLVLILSFGTICFADTIILKSGQQVSGKIIEKTDKYIRIDFQGSPITYYLDEITSINDQAGSSSLKTEAGIKVGALSEVVDRNKIIEEIFILRGLKKQIENIPGLVDAQLAESKNKQNPEVFEIVSKVVAESYQAQTIYQVVFDNLLASFDQDRYLVFADCLRSTLFRKMSQLEEQASTPEALSEMEEYARKLGSNPVSQERIALVQALDEAVGATKLNIEMIIFTNLQMYKAFAVALPAKQRINEDNWEEKFKSSLKSRLEQPMKQNILVAFLYTYQSVSDEELNEYINYWNSNEGNWWNDILSRALLDAMAKVGRDAGNKLAIALPKSQAAQ